MSRRHSYGDINEERAIMRSNYRNMPSGCTQCKYKTSSVSGTADCKVCNLKLMSKSGQ